MSVIALLLFFVLTPGIVVKFPSSGSILVIAGVHAVIFAIVFFAVHKLTANTIYEQFATNFSVICPTGYKYNRVCACCKSLGDGTKTVAPTCPKDTFFSAADHLCMDVSKLPNSYTPSCRTGYYYDKGCKCCKNPRNVKTIEPSCPKGTYFFPDGHTCINTATQGYFKQTGTTPSYDNLYDKRYPSSGSAPGAEFTYNPDPMAPRYHTPWSGSRASRRSAYRSDFGSDDDDYTPDPDSASDSLNDIYNPNSNIEFSGSELLPPSCPRNSVLDPGSCTCLQD